MGRREIMAVRIGVVLQVLVLAFLLTVSAVGGSADGVETQAAPHWASLTQWLQDVDRWRVAGSQYHRVDLDWYTGLDESGQTVAQIRYDFGQRPGTSGVYLQLAQRQELPGYPAGIGLWIYGDGSGHWLRGEIQDAAGARYPLNYTSSYPNGVTWTGWRYVEADVPQGLSGPLYLTAPLRFMALDGTDKGRGVLYVAAMIVRYGGDYPKAAHEPSWQPPDPESLWVEADQAAAVAAETVERTPVGTLEPELLTLTWSAEPAHSQAVTWWTHPTVLSGYVRYQPAAGAGSSSSGWESAATVRADTTILEDETVQSAVHAASLEELDPDTRYLLQLGDGSEHGWSEPYTFRTLANDVDEVSFIYAADTHADKNAHGSGAFNVWRDLMAQALKGYPNTDFVVHGGDMLDQGFSLEQWRSFLASSQGIADHLPFMAAVGNHDVYGQGRDWFREIFSYPSSGPPGLQGTVYSLAIGPLRLVVLDTEVGRSARTEQMRWLEAELANASEPWTVVVLHRAPYISNPQRGPDGVAAAFAPTLERLAVDLVLTAHDHAYMRTHPMQAGQPAAAGTVYVTGGAAGSKFYPGQRQTFTDVVFAEPVAIYSAITVSDEQLRLEAWTVDGHLVDAWEVRKGRETQ